MMDPFTNGGHARFCKNGCVHYGTRTTPGFVGDPLCDGGDIPNTAWWWMFDKGCGSYMSGSDLMQMVDNAINQTG